MIKFISLILDLNNDSSFLIIGNIINKYDNRRILELSQGGNEIVIKISETKALIGSPNFAAFGKQLKVIMFYLKKKIFIKHKVFKYFPIKSLYAPINEDEFKNMHIIFNGKKLDRNDNNSIASLGINDDFECIIE